MPKQNYPSSNKLSIESDAVSIDGLKYLHNTDKRNYEELMQHFEKIKSLEQELSNEKLLNHYTEVRLSKTEKECKQIQSLEQDARDKIRELMEKHVSISKKNGDLMKYCENKVSQCRNEYEKMQQKSFKAMQKNKDFEKEITYLKQRLADNLMHKNECTKLRANLSTLKAQVREQNKSTEFYKTENNTLKNMIETQKHRLNDTSRQFAKVNDDLNYYKQENKRIRDNAVKCKDSIAELQLCNDELTEENIEIKTQIRRFTERFQEQSSIQNEIIDIQQKLSIKELPSLTELSSDEEVTNAQEDNTSEKQ